jgi:hypothetical protein
VRELPNVRLFPSSLSDDMQKAFEAVCAKSRLTRNADRSTDLVMSKIVELAQAGQRGDDLTEKALKFFDHP